MLVFALVLLSILHVLAGGSTISCLYLKGHQMSGADVDVDHRCSLKNKMVYNLPAEVLIKFNINEFKSGFTRLLIEGVDIQGDDMVLSNEDKLNVKMYQHNIMRRQQRSVGVRTIMVVRVQAKDNLDVSWSTSELEYDFFSPTDTSFANQYLQCSNGDLVFLPAVFDSPVVKNGVGDLFLDADVAGLFMSNGIENALTAAFVEKYGSVDQFDHVLFCMPKGMATGWQGYTYGVTWQSYYQDPWCGYYSLPVHEVGHNLGLDASVMIRAIIGPWGSS